MILPQTDVQNIPLYKNKFRNTGGWYKGLSKNVPITERFLTIPISSEGAEQRWKWSYRVFKGVPSIQPIALYIPHFSQVAFVHL